MGVDNEVSFRNSPIPAWTCDGTSLAVLAANEAALARLAWPREGLRSATMRDLAADPDRVALDLADTRVPRFASWRLRGKNGGELVAEVALTPLEEQAWLVQLVHEKVGGGELASRLRAVLATDAVALALGRADGTLEFVTPAVTRVVGVSSSEMTGQRSRVFTHPDDLERMGVEYRALLANPGGRARFRGRAVHRDGSVRWIESSVTNLLDDPEIAAIVMDYRDASDDVHAQEAFVEARRRLEYLLNATSAVTYTCTAAPPFGATFLSESVSAVLGYTARECCADGNFWSDHLHPDDCARVFAELARIFELGRHSLEYRFRHADGTYRWLQDDLVLERDANGTPREIVGCFVDITARREAESALRRSEANFRALIEELPVGVYVHRDDAIVYANHALLSMLGYTHPEDLIGRSPLDLAPKSDRDSVRARIARFNDLDLKRTPTFQSTFLRTSGPPVTVQVEVIKLDFDGVPSTVVIARDLSEHRQILAGLAATDRLASVGTLAAGVAHEINNPLAFVQLNLAMVARELPTLLTNPAASRLTANEVELLLRDAHEGATRLGALVRDLRGLSHPDQQRVTPVDVHEVFESCLRMAQPEIRQRAHVTIARGDIPPVQANASRLGQVFLNLLINAAHAIPEGNPSAHVINVATYRAASSDVVIEVADDGCGIAPDVLGHIFDPFFTTKPVGVGTGLGLAICYSIVRGMGGEITVESEVGRGATFRVILPVSTDPVPLADATSTMRASERKRRVLVIDDERAFGDSLRMALAGVEDVITTTRATAALERLRAGETFDVVLCDLMMPEMSGVEFYEELARIAPSMVDRLVFITGGAFTPSSREFLERVPNRRLEKPFDVSTLLALLEEICARNPAG